MYIHIYIYRCIYIYIYIYIYTYISSSSLRFKHKSSCNTTLSECSLAQLASGGHEKTPEVAQRRPRKRPAADAPPEGRGEASPRSAARMPHRAARDGRYQGFLPLPLPLPWSAFAKPPRGARPIQRVAPVLHSVPTRRLWTGMARSDRVACGMLSYGVFCDLMYRAAHSSGVLPSTAATRAASSSS